MIWLGSVLAVFGGVATGLVWFGNMMSDADAPSEHALWPWLTVCLIGVAIVAAAWRHWI